MPYISYLLSRTDFHLTALTVYEVKYFQTQDSTSPSSWKPIDGHRDRKIHRSFARNVLSMLSRMYSESYFIPISCFASLLLLRKTILFMDTERKSFNIRTKLPYSNKSNSLINTHLLFLAISFVRQFKMFLNTNWPCLSQWFVKWRWIFLHCIPHRPAAPAELKPISLCDLHVQAGVAVISVRVVLILVSAWIWRVNRANTKDQSDT